MRTTDIPKEKQGHLLWKSLSGPAQGLIEWWPVDRLMGPDAADDIYQELVGAYDHVNAYEAQRGFEAAIYELNRDRGETLLDFTNRAVAAFAKNDKHGDPFTDLKKGMMLLRKAKIDGHAEGQLMSMTEGKRVLSVLLPAYVNLQGGQKHQAQETFPLMT